ncbi:RNA polymerase II mediator complex subunit [Elasticomyces elasticus]|nr:RNA polymerase II mediator complex subunit [Elasticomyces elasticus]
MADRLTQLQDCLDDLATQMYACLRYIHTHHPYSPIPGQPDHNPHATRHPSSIPPASDTVTTSEPTNGTAATSQGPFTQTTTTTTNTVSAHPPSTDPVPTPTEAFQPALKELARDLILKEQQVEYLVSVLPGLRSSERDQHARIAELETQLVAAEEERGRAVEMKKRMVESVGEVLLSVRRVY